MRESLIIKKTQLKLRLKKDPFRDPYLRDLVPHKFQPLNPVAVYTEPAAREEQPGVFTHRNKVKITLFNEDRIVLVYRDEDEALEAFQKIGDLPQEEISFLTRLLTNRLVAFYGVVPSDSRLNPDTMCLDWGDPKFCLAIVTKVFEFSNPPLLYKLLKKINDKDPKSLNLFKPMLKAVANELGFRQAAELIEKGIGCHVYRVLEAELEDSNTHELEQIARTLDLSLAPIVELAKSVLDTLRD